MDFENALTFLRKLAKNNNREWFEKNKSAYLKVKEDFEQFVGEVYEGAGKFDKGLTGQDPKKMVFRIYRDVRFSKNKKPYKENLAAGLSESGKGGGRPGYYLHIQPGNESFVCAGLYAPESADLQKIRQEIDYNGEHLKSIFSDRQFRKHYSEFWDEDKLKTVPKGYDRDHPFIDWLKLRSFLVLRMFSDEEVKSRTFAKKVVEGMAAGKPLNDFLRQALD